MVKSPFFVPRQANKAQCLYEQQMAHVLEVLQDDGERCRHKKV